MMIESSCMRAASFGLIFVEGMTVPRTFRISLSSSTASAKSPVMSYIAASIRLPSACPLISFFLNLYLNRLSSFDSMSDRADITFLISPGAGMSIWSRMIPVDPPSSATDTIAEISTGYCLKPRANTLSPVPPPIIVTLTFFMFNAFYISITVLCCYFEIKIIGQISAQTFCQCYRTMLSACTSYADNQLGFPFSQILRQKEAHHVQQFSVKDIRFLRSHHIIIHRLIVPGEWLEFTDI